MHRIRPRLSGLEWQESLWNRLKLGEANDQRRQSFGASRSCRPKERSAIRPHASIAKLPGEFTMCPQDALLFIERRGPPDRASFERLEPCVPTGSGLAATRSARRKL